MKINFKGFNLTVKEKEVQYIIVAILLLKCSPAAIVLLLTKWLKK